MSGHIDSIESSYYTSFQKNNTIALDYEKIIDLTQSTIGQTSFTGFWISDNPISASQLYNGQLNAAYYYDSASSTFVENSEDENPNIGNPFYIFQSQAQGQVLKRVFKEIKQNIYGDPIVIDHVIVDFGVGQNGNVNHIISRTIFGTESLVLRD